MQKLNFTKLDNIQGLIPAIIQDYKTNQVLMLGFMNQASYDQTLETGKVTFFSRTKNRLWTKGESSGNYLLVKEILSDCDDDTLLIKVNAIGSTCHTGNISCFNTEIKQNGRDIEFLLYLYDVVKSRKDNYKADSYTCKLFNQGLDRIVQKVGEEAIETVIASKNDDKILFIGEVSDLMFHLLVLLVEKGIGWEEIIGKLKERHK